MAKAINLEKIKHSRLHETVARTTRTIPCRILIVCEGEKTEPNYFKAFDKSRSGVIWYDIEIHGEGKNTIDVVDRAIELRRAARIDYDSVWAVFDRDSFSADRFNSAIIKARGNDIDCAWSNEAFELWYLLHFHNRVTAMERNEYKKAISKAVNNSPKNKNKKKDYKYAKNATDNHRTINEYGSQEDAIRWAETCHKEYEDEKYDAHNPCTTVYKLVLQLIGKDENFIKKVVKKIDPPQKRKGK